MLQDYDQIIKDILFHGLSEPRAIKKTEALKAHHIAHGSHDQREVSNEKRYRLNVSVPCSIICSSFVERNTEGLENGGMLVEEVEPRGEHDRWTAPRYSLVKQLARKRRFTDLRLLPPLVSVPTRGKTPPDRKEPTRIYRASSGPRFFRRKVKILRRIELFLLYFSHPFIRQGVTEIRR